MIMLVTAAALFGFALGVRYKVFVLIVAMSCIGLGIVISALAFASTLLDLFLHLALVLTCLQLGYIGGALSIYLNLRWTAQTAFVELRRANVAGLNVTRPS